MTWRIPRIGPRAYARIAIAALAILVLIVFSGAAVRLTGSGLGCPTWPECRGHLVTTQLSGHAAIEFGNRMLTGLVSIAAVAAALAALLRRPFRRDLAILGILLPVGVAIQVVLGGMSVLFGLAPGWVMAHFLTSQLIVAAAVALAWRSRPSSDEPSRPVAPRRTVLAARGLLALAAWVLFMGTLATGAGPHPGSDGSTVVSRLAFHGADTMTWVIHWHGRFSTLLGLSAVALWVHLRRSRAEPRLRRASTALCLLLAVQGAVGAVQYLTHLPAAVVWVHVVLATLTWISALYVVAAAGRLAPRREPEAAPAAPAPARAAAA